MNKVLTFILFGLIVSCSSEPEGPSDDYVLIEFASKLEEDYSKLEKDRK